MTTQTLDLLQVPLTGQVLIEASAGTGKTYTISSLVLRRILDPDAPLDIKQILVVTFTKAATSELRARIRSRLKQAAEALQQGDCDDPVLLALLEPLMQTVEQLEAAKKRLKTAILQMDEACIYTIHSFCQQILQQHAFESGSYFDLQLETDESELHLDIAAQIWRQNFYPGSAALAHWAFEHYATPQGLLAKLKPLLDRQAPIYQHQNISDKQLDVQIESAKNQYQALQQQWQIRKDELQDLLITTDKLKRNSYKPEQIPSKLKIFDEYFSCEKNALTLPSGFEYLCQYKISKAQNKNGELIDPFFSLCESLELVLKQFAKQMLAFLLAQFKTLQSNKKQQLRQQGFDDLLKNLHHALHQEQGDLLAKKIRQQFPLALIDEFQDTDACQYEIFSRCYPSDKPKVADDCQTQHDYGLLMIGDPKQAIYQFRGADIHVYLAAREQVEVQRRFTLLTNYRSNSGLVKSVNRLFLRKPASPFAQAPIDYPDVEANDNKDLGVEIQGNAWPGLQCDYIDCDSLPEQHMTKQGIKADSARAVICSQLSLDIAELLQASQQGTGLYRKQVVKSEHIAVLVNTSNEAKLVKQALAQRGIASVFLNRDNIFLSDEARLISLFLQVCSSPYNNALLKALLASDLIGLTLSQIQHLDNTTTAFEEHKLAFLHYHKLWRQSGFMLMWMSFMRDYQVAARVLADDDGQRCLTNLLHLAELTQTASEQYQAVELVFQWLEQNRQEAQTRQSEEQQLRLESDAALVQITTVHSSKGLEYPIVFLPFVYAHKTSKQSAPVLYFDQQHQQSMWDLGSDKLSEHALLASEDVLAEQLRLLYVALTRAVAHCRLYCLASSGFHQSALGYLLFDDTKKKTAAEIQAQITLLAQKGVWQSRVLKADVISDEASKNIAPIEQEQAPLACLKFTGAVDLSFKVSSYSALIRGAHSSLEHKDYDALEPSTIQPSAIERQVNASREKSDDPSGLSIFDFARGAQAGNFIHYVFEHMDFSDTSSLAQDMPGYLQRFALYDEPWVDVLTAFYQNVVQTPLRPYDFSLSQIQTEQRVDEMQFFLPLKLIQAKPLTQFFNQYRADFFSSEYDLELDFKQLQGLLKGFIDLSFYLDGQSFVADYKSNFLGAKPSDYTQAAMLDEMLGHLYDVQLLIYSLAMHRYLALRLDDYEYERDFGGAFYLFVRAMAPEHSANADSAPGVFYHKPPLDRILALEALLCPVAKEVEYG